MSGILADYNCSPMDLHNQQSNHLSKARVYIAFELVLMDEQITIN